MPRIVKRIMMHRSSHQASEHRGMLGPLPTYQVACCMKLSSLKCLQGPPESVQPFVILVYRRALELIM